MASSNDVSETIANDNDEKIINWVEEATAIINDVKMHVAHIEISNTLPSTESNIYMNIRTIEGADYCVHVSAMGFRVVGKAYDSIVGEHLINSSRPEHEHLEDENGAESEEEEIFETPYALLDKISPRYVESFGNQLCKQLLQLQQMRTQFNEEDEEELAEEDEADEAEENNVQEQVIEERTNVQITADSQSSTRAYIHN